MTSSRSALQSLVSFRNSQGEHARGTLLKLDRSSVVFEVYNPYSIVQLSEVLRDLTIRRGERVIYNGRAVVSNLVNTGLMLIVSVTPLDPWRDLEGILGDGIAIRQEAEGFVAEWESASQLRPGYRLAVGEIRSYLGSMSRWLEQVDIAPNPAREDQTLDNAVFAELCDPLLHRLYPMFQDFEGEAAQVPDDAVTIHKTFAQGDLLPLLLRSPFVHRAYHKPLGYAGDYEMVNMIFREPAQGPTTYARIINIAHLLPGAPTAHRNRIDILQRYLDEVAGKAVDAGGTANVVDVGCGPAIEVQRFVRDNPGCARVRLTLIDFNNETLAYTAERIAETAAAAHVTLRPDMLQESVHALLQQSAQNDAPRPARDCEFAYCAGLFDYLSDKVCSRLVKLFYRWIKPGGRVLVSNVHSANPNKFWMDHVMEWHLIYRDEQQMLDLVPGLGRQRVYTDSTGYNVFLELTKPEHPEA